MPRTVAYRTGGFTNCGIGYTKFSQEELMERRYRAMTESEAIEVLKDFGKQVSVKADGAYQSTIGKKACDVAIRSLKKVAREHKGMELTDYWWDAFRGSFETEDDVFDYIFDRVDTSDFEDSYIDAGAHGDCNELVKINASDKRNTMYDFMMAILDEVQQYRVIGTLPVCRAAMEKQTAKRQRIIGNAMICPSCPRCFKSASPTYCPSFGQKLKWEDEE